MSGLYGRPTAAELVAAVADFLDNDVRAPRARRPPTAARSTSTPASPPTCCASSSANCSTSSAADVTAALADLGYADEAAARAAIRAGDLDDRGADVLACLRTIVRRRLDVAHPGYADS